MGAMGIVDVGSYGYQVPKPEKLSKPVGNAFDPKGPSVQFGVDPNTLTVNKSAIFPAKYNAALTRINSEGMYGYVDVTRDGFVINGNHRTLIGQNLGIAVDVSRR